MIEAEDDIYIESKTSSTREEVAAKLIGWLQGSVRRRIIQIDSFGRISEDQLPTAHSLGGPLLNQLEELRDEAQLEFVNALVSGSECFVQLEEAVNQKTELIEKTMIHLATFDDEISKGESCALRLDKVATAKFGIDHYTNISIGQWAQKTFGISIFNFPVPKIETTLQQITTPQITESQVLETEPCQEVRKPQQRRFDALAAELELLLPQMQNPTASLVMAELISRIGKETTCITANMVDYIKWEDGKGKVRKLTNNNLSERIRGWKKKGQAKANPSLRAPMPG